MNNDFKTFMLGLVTGILAMCAVFLGSFYTQDNIQQKNPISKGYASYDNNGDFYIKEEYKQYYIFD